MGLAQRFLSFYPRPSSSETFLRANSLLRKFFNPFKSLIIFDPVG